jgi:hypothetical protein
LDHCMEEKSKRVVSNKDRIFVHLI